MKKLRKNILPVLFLTALVIGMFGLSAITFAAGAKGPNPGKDSFAYVTIYDKAKKTNVALYGSKNFLTASGMKKGKIKGASYSKKTNTLTLNNFNHPAYIVEINEMGSDFKLVVKGSKNSIQNLKVFGFYYGGSCAISGKGTLKVNANKKSESGHGIVLFAEYTPASLTIAKGTTVKAWRNKNADGEKGYPILVKETTKSSKGIVSKGKLSAKVKKTSADHLYNFFINANSVTSK